MVLPTPPSEPPETGKRSSPWPSLLLGLGLLCVAGVGTALIAPQIARVEGSAEPSYLVISLTGVFRIALTALFLAFAGRRIGLGVAWFLFSALFDCVIILFDFVVAPRGLYGTIFVIQDPSDPGPNQAPFFIGIALSIFAGATTLLLLTYGFLRTSADALISTGKRPWWAPGVAIGGCVGLLLLVAGLASGGLTMVSAAEYVGGVVLLLAGTAVGSGILALDRAFETSVKLREVSVLTTCLWLALAVLLVVHAVWVIYMTILVSLVPMRTVLTPRPKSM
jgi:hypothetical protein